MDHKTTFMGMGIFLTISDLIHRWEKSIKSLSYAYGRLIDTRTARALNFPEWR